MSTLPPVLPCSGCGDGCWADGSSVDQPDSIWAGPCWGQVEVIDEDYTEDDHWWIHGCEGHRDRWGRYVAPPPSDTTTTPCLGCESERQNGWLVDRAGHTCPR